VLQIYNANKSTKSPPRSTRCTWLLETHHPQETNHISSVLQPNNFTAPSV